MYFKVISILLQELLDLRGPRNYEYTECYSAEWLRYEARETQKKGWGMKGNYLLMSEFFVNG